MNIFTFAGTGIIMCVLIITVKQSKPELALPLWIACGVILTLYLLTSFLPLLVQLQALCEASGIRSEFIAIAVKAVGICLVAQTAADVCRDAGQTALANKLELGGKAALLLVSLPLFQEMLSLAIQIIGEETP